MDDEQMAHLINGLADEVQAIKQNEFSFEVSNDLAFDCHNRMNTTDPSEMGLFMPVYADYVSQSKQNASWEGLCYHSIEMSYEQISESSFEVIFDLHEKRSAECKEAIYLANTEINHFELFFFAGRHKLTFNMPFEAER